MRTANVEGPETTLINVKEFSNRAVDRKYRVAVLHPHGLRHFPGRDANNFCVAPKGE